MLSPTKSVMAKYRTLLMKMTIDILSNDKAKANSYLLCDVQVMLGLVAIFPLLQFVHNFIKFRQLKDVFVCDFVVAIKVHQGGIFSLYIDLITKFKFDAFEAYKTLVGVRHESIIMRWVTNLNISVEHLTFDVNQQYIWATHLSLKNGVTRFVARDAYVTTITQVEADCACSILHTKFFYFYNLYCIFIIYNSQCTCIGFGNMNMWVSLYGWGY